MNKDYKDIVFEFMPEISAFRNASGRVSIFVTGMNQQESVEIPFSCAKGLAKALNAISKDVE